MSGNDLKNPVNATLNPAIKKFEYIFDYSGQLG